MNTRSIFAAAKILNANSAEAVNVAERVNETGQADRRSSNSQVFAYRRMIVRGAQSIWSLARVSGPIGL